MDWGGWMERERERRPTHHHLALTRPSFSYSSFRSKSTWPRTSRPRRRRRRPTRRARGRRRAALAWAVRRPPPPPRPAARRPSRPRLPCPRARPAPPKRARTRGLRARSAPSRAPARRASSRVSGDGKMDKWEGWSEERERERAGARAPILCSCACPSAPAVPHLYLTHTPALPFLLKAEPSAGGPGGAAAPDM